MAGGRTAGFTLIEALIAIAILSLVTFSMLGTRTEAITDAIEARNWLIARENAERLLSELKAGHREIPPENGVQYPIPGFEDQQNDWWYEIAIGEEFISDVETKYAESLESEAADQARDRMLWQKERDDMRAAERAGKSVYDYRAEQRTHQENYSTDTGTEETPIAEDEFVDVAVFVFFPNVRPRSNAPPHAYFVLKAQISTMALNGLTPTEAETMNKSSGTGTSGTGATGTGSSGGDSGR
jgi:prepilin-type N-terminal cleavage/methylation domain-containing protein